MKLSIESHIAMEKFGDFEGLQIIKKAGFDCVDMSYYDMGKGNSSKLLGDEYREYAFQLKARLDSLGLVCNQAHAPFPFAPGKLDDSNPEYVATMRAIESASILGAKTIIVHSISYKKDLQIFFDRAYNIAFYKSLQPLCEKFNIRIAVENLFNFDNKRNRYQSKLGTSAELREFILELDSPYFVACVDVGHAAMTGRMEPEQFITEIGGTLLKALHIQDGNYREDCHTLPYLGSYNWTNIMQALKQIGYEGELTFEINKYEQNIPKELYLDSLRFAERIGRRLISIFESAESK